MESPGTRLYRSLGGSKNGREINTSQVTWRENRQVLGHKSSVDGSGFGITGTGGSLKGWTSGRRFQKHD